MPKEKETPEPPEPPKPKEKEKKIEFLVQKELPTQPVRSYVDKDKEIQILTVEEALTDIINRLDRIERGITG